MFRYFIKPPRIKLLFPSKFPLIRHSSDTESSEILSLRHNYHECVEAVINQQILKEFNAGLAYLSMACFYARTDIALPGCESFFKKMALEERGHAMDFIKFQLLRGGRVQLFPLTTPENQDWGCATVSLGVALELEKGVKESLECVLETAEMYDEIHLIELITSKYIIEQNESICEIGRLLTRAKNLVDTGKIGEYLFDKELFKNYAKDPKIKYI